MKTSLTSEKIQSYAPLFQSKEIINFFAKVPWCLTGTLQQSEMLKKTLIAESERFKESDQELCFSIITPTWNTKAHFIQELLYSCLLQSWQNWELIFIDNGSTQTEHLEEITRWQKIDSRIKLHKYSENKGISGGRNAGIKTAVGQAICFLDHDDIIHPQALGIIARTFLKNSSVNFIYTNELKISEDSKRISNFYCKPKFSLAGLRRTNYLCHLVAVKKDLLDKVQFQEHSWFKKEFDGCEDHDLYLRLGSLPEFNAEHVAIFSYFWRICSGSTASSVGEKPYVYERATKMLEAHLKEANIEDDVTIETIPTHKFPRQLYSLHFSPKTKKPITLIISYKDKSELTLKCLQSLRNQSYAAYLEIILVNNNSLEEKTRTSLKQFVDKHSSDFKSIKILEYEKTFNYAKIHNWVLKQHEHQPYVLLLNNDVEMSDPKTIDTMVGELDNHKKTAMVSIRLMYPSPSKVQHAGIKIILDNSNLGFFHPTHIKDQNDEFPFDERSAPALSFACVLLRSKVYKELGGLEEDFFPNGFGDVDFCLRAQKKLHECFYLGTISAIHHESASRQTADESFEQLMLTQTAASSLSKSKVHSLSHNGNQILDENLSKLFYLPLRYRIADRVNCYMKKAFGPIHRFAKILLT